MILNGDLQTAKRHQQDLCLFISKWYTQYSVGIVTAGKGGEEHSCVEPHVNFSLPLAGYVSDPMSTMRFHSCSGSFEESSWWQEPSTREMLSAGTSRSHHISLLQAPLGVVPKIPKLSSFSCCWQLSLSLVLLKHLSLLTCLSVGFFGGVYLSLTKSTRNATLSSWALIIWRDERNNASLVVLELQGQLFPGLHQGLGATSPVTSGRGATCPLRHHPNCFSRDMCFLIPLGLVWVNVFHNDCFHSDICLQKAIRVLQNKL